MIDLNIPGIEKGDIEFLLQNLDKMPKVEQLELLKLLEELEKTQTVKAKQDSFLDFAQAMDPNFLVGEHHKIIARTVERIASGDLKRVIINIAPRHGKSHIMSYLFPAWFMGKFPEKKVIMASHTADLAVDFGRKVRNLVADPEYKHIFPEVMLQADSKASGRWGTNHGGEYYACGVGGALAGRGAHLCIIDDPHSEQEAKTGNPAVFDSAYEWYQSGPRQRLMPGGAICLIMCMTGDTKVLMADGTDKRLDQIQVGDTVATYEDEKLSTSKIVNWRLSGVDSIYTIQLQSGIILQANKRHPFLVDDNGVKKWIRLEKLKPGMQLVALQDAIDQQGHKQSPGYAPPANQKPATTENTPMHPNTRPDITDDGKTKPALMTDVSPLHEQEACVIHTTTNSAGKMVNALRHTTAKVVEMLGLSHVMELHKPILMQCSTLKAAFVQYVTSPLVKKIQGHIGTTNSVLTTTMKLERSEDCYAMIATLPLDTQNQALSPNQLPNISKFTVDTIVSITPAGQKEVFDVEVERTENFIANGVVSHNTRWSKRDLTGRILDNMMKNEGSDQWEVIELPMELPSGEPLWPDFWSKSDIAALKNTLDTRYWMAQYQQDPTSEGAAIIKREWWQTWEKDDPPTCEYLIQSWDTAFEKNNRADYSACTTWGVFYQPDDNGVNKANIILLDAFKDRMEFPELKAKALEAYKEYEPDCVLVEKKASGAPLIYELRAMGMLVTEAVPSKDKISRLNAVSDLFSSGHVWAPKTRWAEQVIEEVAEFPVGDHDDYVDSMSQALARFRQGGFITLNTDYEDELSDYKQANKFYQI